MTDATGSYSITDLVAGSYTVTPSKAGHSFTPPSLPVAVPPSAPNVNFAGWANIAPISIDFVLTRDGYSFPNFYDANGRDFNKEELALMCGWENTCANPQSPGASCRLKPEADKWLKDVADDAIGHCRGITTSALRFFTDFDQPAEFQAGATTVHELNLGNSRRNITWQHVLQYLPNMEAHETSPVAALQRVYQALQAGGQALVELSVYQINSDGSGYGHTVLPYAIEDAGGGGVAGRRGDAAGQVRY